MTTNYVQPGDKVVYSNSATFIAAGDIVIIGSLVGVAEVDIATNSGNGTVFVGTGIFEVPKDTNRAWTQGMKITWDANVGKFDTPAGITEATGDIENSCVAACSVSAAAATGLALINVGVGDVHA